NFNVYDVPGLPPGHHAMASTPYGTPGVRLRVDPIPQFYAQAAVYDGLPDFSRSGTRINLNEDEGALSYFEVGYRLNMAKDDEGLPGSYKLGGYYHTDDFANIYEAGAQAFGLTTSAPHQFSGNYGGYFLAEQMVFRELNKDDPAQQGLVGFFRIEGAPPDRNLFQFGVDGGVVYKGLIPTRDWDTFGLAGSYLEMSHDVRRLYHDAGLQEPDYEGVFEASYRAQLTAWWTLQLSYQYVFHPGAKFDVARQDIPDAQVLILQTSLRF